MEIERIRAVIAQMTLGEKIALCGCGGDLVSRAVERLKVESVRLPHELDPLDAAASTGIDSGSLFSHALGCTFDPRLAGTLGALRSAAAYVAGEALGGVINAGVCRKPMTGEGAFSLGEDPLYVARMAEAYIDGADIKPALSGLLGPNRWLDRHIDLRALNEIYLYPLRRTGKKAGGAVIPSGALAGLPCCENKALTGRVAALTTGLIACEPASVPDKARAVSAGAGLEAGDNAAGRALLAAAVSHGTLFEKKLDAQLERLLMLVADHHEYLKNKQPSVPPAGDALDTLARESAVLLKNDGLLPFVDLRRSLLIAEPGMFDDPEAFAAAGANLLRRGKGKAGKGFCRRAKVLAEKFGSAVIVVAAAPDLSEGDLRLIGEVSAVAATAVVLCAPRPMPLPFIGSVRALLYLPDFGSYRAAPLVDILTGQTDPSGRLPVTWAAAPSDYPAESFGRTAGRDMFCHESVLTGYRYFSTFSVKPLFPFGHGLGYGRFEFSRLKLSCEDDILRVNFVVKNVGILPAETVIQVYAGLTGDKIFGLERRLAAFERVRLEKTENYAADIAIKLSDLEVYDAANDAWIVPGGKYEISVGLSSENLALSGSIKIPKTSKTTLGLTAETVPSYYKAPFVPAGIDVEKVMQTPLIMKPGESAALCARSGRLSKKLVRRYAARCRTAGDRYRLACAAAGTSDLGAEKILRDMK